MKLVIGYYEGVTRASMVEYTDLVETLYTISRYDCRTLAVGLVQLGNLSRIAGSLGDCDIEYGGHYHISCLPNNREHIDRFFGYVKNYCFFVDNEWHILIEDKLIPMGFLFDR